MGFQQVGSWRLDPTARAGVRFELNALRSDRVVYAFVAGSTLAYIGICESATTTLADRMSRYQNIVGAGTNELVVDLIKARLLEGNAVEIYALKPTPGPNHLNLQVDYIRGFESPLIERLRPPWNRRR